MIVVPLLSQDLKASPGEASNSILKASNSVLKGTTDLPSNPFHIHHDPIHVINTKMHDPDYPSRENFPL